MRRRSLAWAVERRVFPFDEEQRLIRALESREIDVYEFVGHDFRQFPEITEVAVPRGSCYFVLEMSHSPNWPGDLWGQPQQFDCSTYFPSFAGHLLNGRGRFMSLGELFWTFPMLLAEFGDAEQRIFVRPDDGFKSFEGGIVSEGGFEQWANRQQLLQVPSHTRVLVAEPVQLSAEWRVVLVDGRAVASSQYQPAWLPGAPMEVVAFAEHRHREASWPIGAYTMDIAQTEEGLKIVEVGSSLCVAFYESSVETIVDAVQLMVETKTGNAP